MNPVCPKIKKLQQTKPALSVKNGQVGQKGAQYQGHWRLTADHAMLFFIFIIFYLELKWTRLMLCPLRNTFRKTLESSRKPIKTTSLKPGDGITLMRIFDLSGIILENTVL